MCKNAVLCAIDKRPDNYAFGIIQIAKRLVFCFRIVVKNTLQQRKLLRHENVVRRTADLVLQYWAIVGSGTDK